jgi:hypothetical protein
MRDYGRHREQKTVEIPVYADTIEESPRGRRAFQWFVYVTCTVILVVMGLGAAVSVSRGPEDVLESNAVLEPTDEPALEPSVETEREDSTPPVESSRRDEPVDPECWESRDAAEIKRCQEVIAKNTKFIKRYQTNQASLARTHPIVKLADVGRPANSLGRHGLLTCWLVHEGKYSLDDIRAAFYLWFHKHPFTVPNDDTDAAADNIIFISVQEVCPSEAKALEEKGGPKADIVVPDE